MFSYESDSRLAAGGIWKWILWMISAEYLEAVLLCQENSNKLSCSLRAKYSERLPNVSSTCLGHRSLLLTQIFQPAKLFSRAISRKSGNMLSNHRGDNCVFFLAAVLKVRAAELLCAHRFSFLCWALMTWWLSAADNMFVSEMISSSNSQINKFHPRCLNLIFKGSGRLSGQTSDFYS